MTAVVEYPDRQSSETNDTPSTATAENLTGRPSARFVVPATYLERARLSQQGRPMSSTRRPGILSIYGVFFLALVGAAPDLLFAKDALSAEVPANAHGQRYGSGWECDPGYRKAKQACAAVRVPANAYPTDTSYGTGWECSRGYQEVDKACVFIKVPPNAYLGASGDRWKCDRGYRLTDKACVAISVPANGYLTESSYGSDWQCDRGHRAVGEACVAITVPANGYLTESSYRSGWDCDRGYRVVDQACIAVEVPEHAHLDYSGNDWQCDHPYRKQQHRCAMP
jgi:hypothetical protein